MSRKTNQDNTFSLDESLEKTLLPNTEDPYSLPPKWQWVYLSGILREIKNGTTAKQDKSGNGYLVTRIESLQNQTIDFNRLGTIVNNKDIKESDWYIADDIVLSHINSSEHVGKTALIKKDMLPLVHGMNLLRLRFIPVIMPLLFQYYSQSYQYKESILSKIHMAVNQVSINQKQLGTIVFPLAPLDEQQRIIDRIESLFAKLDEAKEKAQEVIDGFDDRKSAILHKAFSGDLTAEWRNQNDHRLKKWENKLLGNVTDNYDSKRIPLSKAEREKLEKKYDYYGASGIIDKVDQFIFDGKYLLIGEDGANLVMRSKPIAFIADGKFWVNNHAHVLKVKPDKNMEYLCYYINSISLAPYVTGSAQPKMSQSKMNTIPVPIPEYAEQNEIVRILDSLVLREQKAKETAEQVIKHIEVMKKAILARAFRGELGTNDPNDEPAIELLKRVLSDESTKESEPKPVKKRITIPKELSNQLGTVMERKIIRLYFEMDTDVLSLDDIFSVSSKKLDVLDCIRTLEKKQIIIQEENGKYRLVR